MADQNSKPPAQVVGLKTVNLRARAGAFREHTGIHTPQRPRRPGVFTEEELRYLMGRSDEDLWSRIYRGQQLLQLLTNPAIMNLAPEEVTRFKDRLNFQMDEIEKIIKNRGPQRPEGESHG